MSSKNYFETNAPQWDAMRKDFFPDNLSEKIAEKANIQQKEVVVDLGCGSGFITKTIKDFDISIIAIDQSEKMLQVMRNKFQAFENISYKSGSGTSIPLDDKSVDTVLANMYLHHIEEPIVAFNEIYRILKPGGKFVFADLDKHNHDFLRAEQNDVWLGFERNQLKNWLEKSGFQNINIDCADSDCCSASKKYSDSAQISIFIASAIK